jgi:hypothetical protein
MEYTHQTPGRVRVRSAALKGDAAGAEALERWLKSVPGVRRVHLNVLTGSALIYYDLRIADGAGLLALLREEGWLSAPVAPPAARALPPIPQRKNPNPLAANDLQRAIFKAILTTVAEAAIQRSVIALAAAIL